MRFKITTLVENTVPMRMGLIGEHGLSFFIEADNRKVLFDTGQGFSLAGNAKALGINLKEVEAVVLSHGHYDHTGGMNALLDLNRHFTLYAHPDVFCDKFSKKNGKLRSIGFSFSKENLESMGIRVVIGKGPMEIIPGVSTTGEVPMTNSFETIDDALFSGQKDALVPDPLKDDLSLVLATQEGFAVILGCAHRGVINILSHVREWTGRSEILAVLGGLHLGGATRERIDIVVRHLEGFQPGFLIPGHCTGFNAVMAIFNIFKDRTRLNQVGSVVEF